MSEEKDHPPVARAAARAKLETVLAGVIEPVKRVARDMGYAITVHGSLARDIDLVAVPWVEHHVAEPEALIQRIAAVLASQIGACSPRIKDGGLDWSDKPHGRRGTTLIAYGSLIGHIDFDVSVMPTLAAVDVDAAAFAAFAASFVGDAAKAWKADKGVRAIKVAEVTAILEHLRAR